jgi:hypothetical protein
MYHSAQSGVPRQLPLKTGANSRSAIPVEARAIFCVLTDQRHALPQLRALPPQQRPLPHHHRPKPRALLRLLRQRLWPPCPPAQQPRADHPRRPAATAAAGAAAARGFACARATVEQAPVHSHPAQQHRRRCRAARVADAAAAAGQGERRRAGGAAAAAGHVRAQADPGAPGRGVGAGQEGGREARVRPQRWSTLAKLVKLVKPDIVVWSSDESSRRAETTRSYWSSGSMGQTGQAGQMVGLVKWSNWSNGRTGPTGQISPNG